MVTTEHAKAGPPLVITLQSQYHAGILQSRTKGETHFHHFPIHRPQNHHPKAGRRRDPRARPARLAAPHAGNAAHAPSGDLFGLSQNVGMGWEPPARSAPKSSSSARTAACAPQTAPRSLSASTPATGKSASLVAEAAADALKPGRHPLRRSLHRSLRRPHPGHHRHDRLPALPQRRRHRPSAA